MKQSFSTRIAIYGWRTGLLFAALTAALALTFGGPDLLRAALRDSGVYTVAAGQVADTASSRILEKAENVGLGLANDTVKKAADETFTPSAIQNSAEKVIDNAYHWLQGKDDKPDLSVDISGYTDTFRQKLVGEAAVQKVEEATDQTKSLPACTSAQIQALITQYGTSLANLDAVQLGALPCSLFSGVDTGSLLQQVREQASQVAEANPGAASGVIDTSDVPKEVDSIDVSKVDFLPGLYSLGMWLPWLFGLLALFSALAAWALAGAAGREGVMRSLARSLLFTGVFLLVIAAFMRLLTWLLAKPDGPVANWVSNAFGTAFVKFISIIEHRFDGTLFIIGSAYVAIAAVALLAHRHFARQSQLVVEHNPELRRQETTADSRPNEKMDE